MLTLRGLTFDAAAPRIIVPLFARSLGALRPLAAAADADPAAEEQQQQTADALAAWMNLQ